jgi:diguanylate cyclase (GGDEF)-like protein/PAS domain S-box-containing protein
MVSEVGGPESGDRPFPVAVWSSHQLDLLPVGVLMMDASGHVLGANVRALELLGLDEAEFLTRRHGDLSWGLVREDGRPFPPEELPFARALATGEVVTGVVIGLTAGTRGRRWVQAGAHRVTLEEGGFGVVASFVDVSASQRTRRLLEMTRRVEQALIEATGEEQFFTEMCEAIVTAGQFALAWVGVAASDGGEGVEIRASAGRTDYLYEGIVSWWGSVPSGQGPTGIALRSGEVRMAPDLGHLAFYAPWRERAARYHLGSSLAIPLTWADNRAVLTIYHDDTHAFDEETVEALTGFAREAEFAVDHVQAVRRTTVALAGATEALEAKVRAEERLRHFERRYSALLAHSSDWIFIVDARGVITWANEAARFAMGVSDVSAEPLEISTFVHPEDRAAVTANLERTITSSGAAVPGVYRVRTVDGDWRYIETLSTNCLDDPEIGGVVVNARDVTERITLTRALTTLTAANQVLVRASDEDTLMQEICEAIVTSGPYGIAWVGRKEDDEAHSIVAVAAAGEVDVLNEIVVTWDDGPTGQGPTGRAVRSGEPQVVLEPPESWPAEWLEASAAIGLPATCALPLVMDGQVYGALSIAAYDPGAFTTEAMNLFAELAEDVTFGLTRLHDAKVLADTGRNFQLAFEANSAPMLFSDLEDRITAVNDAFCEMTGYSRDELMGGDSRLFTHPDDVGRTEDFLLAMKAGRSSYDYEKRYVCKDGRVIHVQITRAPAKDAEGNILYFVSSERDVTEEHDLNEALRNRALHDDLTGLANRALFEEVLSEAPSRAERSGNTFAVLLVDLDEFKGINDTFGHPLGDDVIKAVARRFELVTRATDKLSRFGGDEFLYLAEGLTAPEDAQVVAQRLLDALVDPVQVGALNLVQGASVGIAVTDGSVIDPLELIKRADVALYSAKRGGRSRFTVFDPSMSTEVTERFTILHDLRPALVDRQLEMHYQPIVDLATGRAVGFESLMRWSHPTLGPVSPDLFIRLAEESDLVLDLGYFALDSAVAQASTWGADDAPYVTVNLSARQFRDSGLVAVVAGALERHGLAPRRLMIEITESTTIHDIAESRRIIDQLRALGVEIIVDDFGTGESSMRYLHRLAPSIVKIDREFILTEAGEEGMLEAIAAFCGRLKMLMVAEGVETPEQLGRLQATGCPYGQGYLFSRPVPASAVAGLLDRPLL